MKHKLYKKLVLIILDGFGVAVPSRGNAITNARTPTFKQLAHNYPSMSLQASGPLVGLPWGEMGNSEVGHLNMGAGRIVGQDLPRISTAIQNGKFFENSAFLEAISHAKKNNTNIHLVGMVSSGGVHSLDQHLYALLSMCAENNKKDVYVHMITDGRDTEPKVALGAVKKLADRMRQIGCGTIATVTGRFFAMDRGNHWDQTKLTYDAMVNGHGEIAQSAEACIQQNYEKQIFDEMIRPTVIINQYHEPVACIEAGDSVIFFNFRPDRALQLVQLFTASSFVPEEFRVSMLENVQITAMTQYDVDLPVVVAFPPVDLENNLAEVIARNGLRQLHMAETEKYAHVTIFFNCGHSQPYALEDRIIVQSPMNTNNYSDHPEMSAQQLTAQLTEKISRENYTLYVVNYANGDIIGHTGNFTAGVQAVECLDDCIRKVVEACLAQDAVLMITADHGNIEQMINVKTGEIDKDHTTNPVPFLLVAHEFKFAQPKTQDFASLAFEVPAGVISDIAPTVLELLGLTQSTEMTGISLLKVLDNPVGQ